MKRLICTVIKAIISSRKHLTICPMTWGHWNVGNCHPRSWWPLRPRYYSLLRYSDGGCAHYSPALELHWFQIISEDHFQTSSQIWVWSGEWGWRRRLANFRWWDLTRFAISFLLFHWFPNCLQSYEAETSHSRLTPAVKMKRAEGWGEKLFSGEEFCPFDFNLISCQDLRISASA